jgi:serine/threonine protein kinase
VAIKRISIREDNILEVKRLVREVCLLRHFNHENIIGLRDIIEPCEQGSYQEVYIVSDLMDTDLHQIIRSPQSLTEEHIQFFLYQLLRGLKPIHSARVLHRDLKPSNIVVNSNCDLKICDFGLAREIDDENDMTDYVATRWYRAPELLMQWREYSAAVDVWSIGCIFAELLQRRPIFPGKNYLDQLNLIIAIVGTPNMKDIETIGSERARAYIRQLVPKRERKCFKKMFPNASSDALDLLEKMLQFNPMNRITVIQALNHRYFAQMHDPDDEPDAPEFKFKLDMNDPSLTVMDLKDVLFKQMLAFHPEYSSWQWQQFIPRAATTIRCCCPPPPQHDGEKKQANVVDQSTGVSIPIVESNNSSHECNM